MFLKNGAIFIADAHYHPGLRKELVEFVGRLLQNPPPQLFLMGDIFDLLVGDIPSTIEMNRPLVERLRSLSRKCECYYFEGNHDFNLVNVFPQMSVYPRPKQPVVFEADGKRVALAHGDLEAGFGYEFYTATIRNPLVLTALRLLNMNDWIVRKIQEKNARKNHCKKIENFEEIVEKKLKLYSQYDLAIEGHYHQNFFSQRYFNLPSFACAKNLVVYENSNFSLKRFDGSFQNSAGSQTTQQSPLSQ